MTDPHFQTFDDLLRRSLSEPGAEREILRRYSREVAVLVVDFTGMVHRTDHEGIVYALAMARAAEARMRPAVQDCGGEVVKRVADSFFAVFSDATAALAATRQATRAMADFNRERTGRLGDGDRNEPIHACAGLGLGDTLVLPGENLYGPEVNRAFVLGEDLARGGEILCTERFLDALHPLPEGLGAHLAPADRQKEAGFPFHLLVDYADAE